MDRQALRARHRPTAAIARVEVNFVRAQNHRLRATVLESHVQNGLVLREKQFLVQRVGKCGVRGCSVAQRAERFHLRFARLFALNLHDAEVLRGTLRDGQDDRNRRSASLKKDSTFLQLAFERRGDRGQLSAAEVREIVHLAGCRNSAKIRRRFSRQRPCGVLKRIRGGRPRSE